MTEENTNVEPEVQKDAVASVASPSAPPQKPVQPSAKPDAYAPPKVVREAEHKLKEMSRKAKERKTAQNNARHPKGLSEINYFWLVIGGLGALGVGYLVFGKKDEVRPRQRFKFVPRASGLTPAPTPKKTPVKEEIKKEDVATPKFELNCF